MTKINNSEILFLYDAKQCNPNGDMDNENKPRMDWDTNTNLVSDVRLKRYIRDYLKLVKNKEIFVDEKAEDAKKRVKQICGKDKDLNTEDIKKICDICFDIKLFGAVFATSGGNTHLTGPVQFNWGYSLNKVELQESKTITNSFSKGEGIGKDYRVNYSLIAFNGGINGKTAIIDKNNNEINSILNNEDLKLFDEAVIKAIPFNRTRSKIGQQPRLYIRVELINDEIILKDLREYIKIKSIDNIQESQIRNISEIKFDFSELINYLKINNDVISKIYFWKDDKIKFDLNDFNNEKVEVLKF